MTTERKPIKTYGAVPKTLLRACERMADKVKEVGGEDSDGYWVYIRPGFWNPLDETMCVHEYTVADCISKMKSIRADPRPENKR